MLSAAKASEYAKNAKKKLFLVEIKMLSLRSA
jgi:hypothetical protein